MGGSGNCYVYVYIDPRNYEEFYYGKGRGSRKSAHLSEDSDSEKVRRIAAIKRARLDPIIRVVARGLTDDQALLIEKTLLWKLGRHLTNVSTGHFVQHFRPHDTLHKLISGFDYESGVYYYNIGEGPHRNWDDYLEFGFISAGQGVRRRDAMLGFHEGDVIAAYLKRRGFVGIGRIASSAKPIREVKLQGKALLSHQLRCTNMDDNVESNDLCEYVSRVEWIKTVDRAEAYMIRKAGIFTTQLVRASLEGQPATITFLNQAFGLRIRDYIL